MRSSVSVIVSPLFKNASSFRRYEIVASWYSVTVNTASSGMKCTSVPCFFVFLRKSSNGASGTPDSYFFFFSL